MIVGASMLDLLDGRIARFTATGSSFGEELDSLVDAISFGVAPAIIMYFAFLGQGGEWSWILAYLYVVGAVFRLARFNIEQAGTAKAAFHGLPSPTAGATLATYYAFTQTAFWGRHLSDISPTRVAAWLMMLMAILMVSNVLYPVVPRFSMRTWGGRFAIVVAISAVVAAFTYPAYFFFPFAIAYITYGVTRTVFLGFLERGELSSKDPLLDDDEEEEEFRELHYENMKPHRPARSDEPYPGEEPR